VGSTPEGPYGLIPPGQPAPMRDAEYEPALRRPRLFGQAYREIAGVPRVIIVPQPVAATDWTYTHSGPSWFLLRNVIGQLVTSATVATRIARLQLTYQSVLAAQLPPSASQAASLTVVYNTSTTFAGTADAGTALWVLPEGLIVKDGMKLASSTTALSAGDQWSAIALLVEEFTDRCLDGY